MASTAALASVWAGAGALLGGALLTLRTGRDLVTGAFGAAGALLSQAQLIALTLALLVLGVAYVRNEPVIWSNVESAARTLSDFMITLIRPILSAVVALYNALICWVNFIIYMLRFILPETLRILLGECIGIGPLASDVGDIAVALLRDVAADQLLNTTVLLNRPVNISSLEVAVSRLAQRLIDGADCVCADLAPFVEVILSPLLNDQFWCALQSLVDTAFNLLRPLIQFLISLAELQPFPGLSFNDLSVSICRFGVCFTNVIADFLQKASDEIVGVFDGINMRRLLCAPANLLCIAGELLVMLLDIVFNFDRVIDYPSDTFLADTIRWRMRLALNYIAEPSPFREPSTATGVSLDPLISSYDRSTRLELFQITVAARLVDCLTEILRIITLVTFNTIDVTLLVGVFPPLVDATFFLLDLLLNAHQPRRWAQYWDFSFVERVFAPDSVLQLPGELFRPLSPLLSGAWRKAVRGLAPVVRTPLELIRVLVRFGDQFGYFRTPGAFAPRTQIRCSAIASDVTVYSGATGEVCNLRDGLDATFLSLTEAGLDFCDGLEDGIQIAPGSLCCMITNVPRVLRFFTLLTTESLLALPEGDPDNIFGEGDLLQEYLDAFSFALGQVATCACQVISPVFDFFSLSDANPCDCLQDSVSNIAKNTQRIVVGTTLSIARTGGFTGGYLQPRVGIQPATFTGDPGDPNGGARRLLDGFRLTGASALVPVKGDVTFLTEAVVELVTCPLQLFRLFPDLAPVIPYLQEGMVRFVLSIFEFIFRTLLATVQLDSEYFDDFDARTVMDGMHFRRTSDFFANFLRVMDSFQQPPPIGRIDFFDPVEYTTPAPLNGEDPVEYPDADSTLPGGVVLQTGTNPGVLEQRQIASLLQGFSIVLDRFLPSNVGRQLMCPINRGFRVLITLIALVTELIVRVAISVVNFNDFQDNVFGWLFCTPDISTRTFANFSGPSCAPSESFFYMLTNLARCPCFFLANLTAGPFKCLCGNVSPWVAVGRPVGLGIVPEMIVFVAEVGRVAVTFLRDAVQFATSVSLGIVSPLTVAFARIVLAFACVPREFFKLALDTDAVIGQLIDSRTRRFTVALTNVIFAIPKAAASVLDQTMGSTITRPESTYQGFQPKPSFSFTGFTNFKKIRPLTGKEEFELATGKITEEEIAIRLGCSPDIQYTNPEGDDRGGCRHSSNRSNNSFDDPLRMLFTLITSMVQPLLDLLLAFVELLEALVRASTGVRLTSAIAFVKIFQSTIITILWFIFQLLRLVIDFIVNFRTLDLPALIRYGKRLFRLIIDALRGLPWDNNPYRTSAKLNLGIDTDYNDEARRRRSEPGPGESAEHTLLSVARSDPSLLTAIAWVTASPEGARTCLSRGRLLDCACSLLVPRNTSSDPLQPGGPHDAMRALCDRAVAEQLDADWPALARALYAQWERDSSACSATVREAASMPGPEPSPEWVDCALTQARAYGVRSLVGPDFPLSFYRSANGWQQWLVAAARNGAAQAAAINEASKLDALAAQREAAQSGRAEWGGATGADGLYSAGLEHLSPRYWRPATWAAPSGNFTTHLPDFAVAVAANHTADGVRSGRLHRLPSGIWVETFDRQRAGADETVRTLRQVLDAERGDVTESEEERANAEVARSLLLLCDQSPDYFDADTCAWIRGEAECPPDLDSRPHGLIVAPLTRTIVPWMSIPTMSQKRSDEFMFGPGHAHLASPISREGPPPGWGRRRRAPPPGTSHWAGRDEPRAADAFEPVDGHDDVPQVGTSTDLIGAPVWGRRVDAPQRSEGRAARRRTAARSLHRRAEDRAFANIDPSTGAGYVNVVRNQAPIRFVPGLKHRRLNAHYTRAGQLMRLYVMNSTELAVHYEERRNAGILRIARHLKKAGIVGPESDVHPALQVSLLRGAQALHHVADAWSSGMVHVAWRRVTQPPIAPVKPDGLFTILHRAYERFADESPEIWRATWGRTYDDDGDADAADGEHGAPQPTSWTSMPRRAWSAVAATASFARRATGSAADAAAYLLRRASADARERKSRSSASPGRKIRGWQRALLGDGSDGHSAQRGESDGAAGRESGPLARFGAGLARAFAAEPGGPVAEARDIVRQTWNRHSPLAAHMAGNRTMWEVVRESMGQRPDPAEPRGRFVDPKRASRAVRGGPGSSVTLAHQLGWRPEHEGDSPLRQRARYQARRVLYAATALVSTQKVREWRELDERDGASIHAERGFVIAGNCTFVDRLLSTTLEFLEFCSVYDAPDQPTLPPTPAPTMGARSLATVGGGGGEPGWDDEEEAERRLVDHARFHLHNPGSSQWFTDESVRRAVGLVAAGVPLMFLPVSDQGAVKGWYARVRYADRPARSLDWTAALGPVRRAYRVAVGARVAGGPRLWTGIGSGIRARAASPGEQPGFHAHGRRAGGGGSGASGYGGPGQPDGFFGRLDPLRITCQLLDFLGLDALVDAIEDFLNSSSDWFTNPNLDENAGPVGLAFWVNFITSCPAVDSISCTNGVGAAQALLDIAIWALVGALVLGQLVPAGLSSLAVMAYFWVLGFVFIIHAWRLPPRCLVFGVQFPLCAGNDLLEVFDGLFRRDYGDIIPGCMLPPNATTALPVGEKIKFFDCRATGMSNPLYALVYAVDRWIPGACGPVAFTLNSLFGLRLLAPQAAEFVDSACRVAGLRDLPEAQATDFACRLDTCFFRMLPLTVPGLLFLVILVRLAFAVIGLLLAGLVGAIGVGGAALGVVGGITSPIYQYYAFTVDPAV